MCSQCRINHVADVANATGLEASGGPLEVQNFFQPIQNLT